MAPTAWSIPPVTTQVFVDNPNCPAASGESVPTLVARLDDLGQLFRSDADGVLDIRPPGILDQVVIQGGAGYRAIGDDPARQSVDQVILNEQELVRPGKDFRLVLAYPQYLAGRPGGYNLRDAGPGINFLAESLRQESSLIGSAVIQPDQGRIDRLSASHPG